MGTEPEIFFLILKRPGNYTYCMQYNRQPLKDRHETARRIKHLIETYYTDLHNVFYKDGYRTRPVTDLTLQQYFDLVKNIPYRRDPKPFEIVARPYYLFKHRDLGLDCKKKSVLCGAFIRMKNFKYRAIGSSSREDLKVHHIYMQLYDTKKKAWRNVDATYPDYVLYEEKPTETFREVLK